MLLNQSNTAVLLNIVNYFVNCCECHAYAGVGTAVVDCDSACILVAEGSAGECNVLNVAYALIDLLRADEVFSASVLDLPRLVDVGSASREAVNEAVAAFENAVIEAEPAFRGFYRDRTCADLL